MMMIGLGKHVGAAMYQRISWKSDDPVVVRRRHMRAKAPIDSCRHRRNGFEGPRRSMPSSR